MRFIHRTRITKRYWYGFWRQVHVLLMNDFTLRHFRSLNGHNTSGQVFSIFFNGIAIIRPCTLAWWWVFQNCYMYMTVKCEWINIRLNQLHIPQKLVYQVFLILYEARMWIFLSLSLFWSCESCWSSRVTVASSSTSSQLLKIFFNPVTVYIT